MRNLVASCTSDSISMTYLIGSISRRRSLDSSRWTRAIRNAARVGFLFVVISDCIGAQDPPQTPPFVLDLEATASGKPVVLSRPENGVVNLNIVYIGTAESEAQIVTTAFTSESGSVAWIFLIVATQLPSSL